MVPKADAYSIPAGYPGPCLNGPAGTVLWPSAATPSVSSTDTAGHTYPPTGPGAYSWFMLNGAASIKQYSLVPGCGVTIHAWIDCCSACSVPSLDLGVEELIGVTWVQKGSVLFPYTPWPACQAGATKDFSFTPSPGVTTFRIVARKSGYACVYQK